jgi:hypothetical protein
MSEESAPKPIEKETQKKEIPPIKKQIVYRMVNGEWSDFEEQETIDKTDFYKIFHRELNPKGELIVEMEFDHEGNEIQKTANTFNDKGEIIKHELYNEGQLVEKTDLEYDAKGQLTKETREFDEGYPLTTFFTYDEEGRVTEKRVDDSDGELQKRETFTYHPEWKDKVVRHVIFDEEDKPSVEEDNEWEERGGEVKARKFIVKDHTMNTFRRTEFFDPRTREDNIAMATFNEKEKVLEYVKVFFDEKDREKEEQSISINDSDNFKVHYTYDDEDRVIVQEQHQEDKIISKINRRFGKYGLAELIAIRSFSRGMYVDAFEYEFHS